MAADTARPAKPDWRSVHRYAIPLYLQAISLLVPPPNSGKRVSAAEICRGAHLPPLIVLVTSCDNPHHAGAQLMSNLSELLMRGSPSPQKVHQAELWAKQGLSVIEKTQKNARGSRSESEGLQIFEVIREQTYYLVLFNFVVNGTCAYYTGYMTA